MDILLTNDDGIYSIGVQTAARRLRESGHNVLLLAPDRERSGCGHAMTLDRPVHVRDVDRRFLSSDFAAKSCDGTPTDCVVMAIDMLGFTPDMVISGINQGPNLGDDLTYSGTVCAAMEGVIFGIPSMAVSLVMSSRACKAFNETAADVMAALIEWVKDNPMPPGVLYNVNVPNMPLDVIRGIAVTKKGVRRYVNKVKTVLSPSGERVYWIGGNIEDDMTEGTDVCAIADGYVSVTPVHMEMTSFDAYKECKDAGMDNFLENCVRKMSGSCLNFHSTVDK